VVGLLAAARVTLAHQAGVLQCRVNPMVLQDRLRVVAVLGEPLGEEHHQRMTIQELRAPMEAQDAPVAVHEPQEGQEPLSQLVEAVLEAVRALEADRVQVVM
jgi:hypothetical protein